MSIKKPYKQPKRGKGQFVKLDHWLMKSEAWRSLTPNAKALYLELKYFYNGSNNGNIFLSHRNAETRLNVTRPTVAKAFKDLEEKGFIKLTQGYCLGSEGKGKANHYALTEIPHNGKLASKEFMKWKQNQ